MLTSIYSVGTIGDGELFVMPKPSSDWLTDDVRYYSSLGVSLVVSHLEEAEAWQLGLAQEQEVLTQHGIQFQSFPIVDRALPNSDAFRTFIVALHEQLLQGVNVAVHCRAGIGRAGVTTACLLVQDGYKPDVAIEMVSAARGVLIHDTEEQFDFICDYVPSHNRA